MPLRHRPGTATPRVKGVVAGRRRMACLEEAQLVFRVGNEQVLRLLVMVEHDLVGLAADTGFLVAAEGSVGRVGVVAVGPDAAGLDGATHTVGYVAVTAPHASAEAG